jgi:FMN phosphatase YigB (HAD superfamily)
MALTTVGQYRTFGELQQAVLTRHGAAQPEPKLFDDVDLGLERLGAAGNACLVAAHEWDLMGAAAVGIQTAHLARDDRPPAVHAPDWWANALTGLFA